MSLIWAAAISASLILAAWLQFPDQIQAMLRLMQPATQEDLRIVSSSLQAYDDWLSQKYEARDRAYKREQELFSDIVGRVFPTKWESYLYTLTESEFAGLKSGAEVPIYVRYSRFKSKPHVYTVLKNINFTHQPNRSTFINVSSPNCDDHTCIVRIQLRHPSREGRANLMSKPQIHWIFAGEFPDVEYGQNDQDIDRSSDQ